MLPRSCISIDRKLHCTRLHIQLKVPRQYNQAFHIFISSDNLNLIINTCAHDIDDLNVPFKVTFDIFEFIFVAAVADFNFGNLNVFSAFHN